jgi:hypothetical protein
MLTSGLLFPPFSRYTSRQASYRYCVRLLYEASGWVIDHLYNNIDVLLIYIHHERKIDDDQTFSEALRQTQALC